MTSPAARGVPLSIAGLTIKEAWARRRRLAGSFVAVFLGVAFLTGTLVLADTLGASIDGFIGRAYENTDVVVRNATQVTDEPGRTRAGIDGSVVDRIRRVAGVAAAEPVIQGSGQILDRRGKVIEVRGPRNAGNWVADPALNQYRIVTGRAPRAPDEVVINRGAARDGGLRVGDRTAVLMPGRVPVTVVGISRYGDEDGYGGSSFAAFTLDAARRYVAGSPGRVTSVSVRAGPGVGSAELAGRVRRVLRPGTEAITGKDLVRESTDAVDERFVSAFRTALAAFAGVALLVAAFSIHNTFAILVAQRTRESALLRALGAGRGQLMAAVTVEALAVGGAAALAGPAGGVGVAALLKMLFAGFGVGPPAQGLVVTAGTALLGGSVGVVVTVLASLVPAVRASRVPPVAALREAATERPGPSDTHVIVGSTLAAVAVAATAWGALSRTPSVTIAGAVMSAAVMVILGPVVARPIAALAGRPAMRWRGVGGTLARHNAMRNPRRTAGAATALMIGVGVVTLLTVFTASLRASMADDVSGSFRGELVVTGDDGPTSGFSPRLASEVAALPQVASVAGMGRGDVRIDGAGESVAVGDPRALGAALNLDVASGTLPQAAAPAPTGPRPPAASGGSQGSGGLAVSAEVADERGWRVGSAVTVTFGDGARERLPVSAIYRSDGVLGDFLLPRQVWAAHAGGQVRDSLAFVHLRPGAGVAEGRSAIESVARSYGSPDVQDRDRYVAARTARMDAFVGVVYVMLALAIVIALLGIANALALAVHERTHEVGLLRAVGATRGQIRSMVRWESVIVAAFGTAGGVGLGLYLGWALTRSTVDAFAAPPAQLALIALVGAVAGVPAAVRPARRAARLDPLAAIASP